MDRGLGALRDPDQAEALARAFGQAGQRFRFAFEGFVFKGPAEAARRLSKHPRVRKVTATAVVAATAETVPTGVRRIQADAARSTSTGSGQRVAILNSSIDLDHPDLSANVDAAKAKNCVDSRRSADDDNGHGAIKVINMSLSGSGSAGSCTDGYVREAVCRAV